MKIRREKQLASFFSGKTQGLKGISVWQSSILLILILAVMATLIDSTFIHPTNIINIIDVFILYFILGAGLTFVMVVGATNLAVGGMLSLNCVLFALFSEKIGLWAIPLVFIFGFIEGLLTGMVYKIFGIPSFIATFGMMGIFTSIAVLISGGAPIVLDIEVARSLKILGAPVIPGIKFQYFLTLLIFLVFLFIQKRTAYGKKVFSVGDSPIAAKHIGLNIHRIKNISFGLSGLTNAMGAIILCTRSFAGDPTVGTSYLLLIISVVVVGGTSLAGGVGGVINTLLGALTIAVLQNVLYIMGVNIYYHPVVIGVVLIIAVAMSLNQRKIQVVK